MSSRPALCEMLEDSRCPLVLGHRGAPEEETENTLPSLLRALDIGADGVELDARVCASGEVVVIHDATVDRVTNGTGLIRKLTLAQIRELSIRSGDAFVAIPTLEEVFDSLPAGAIINVELKSPISARNPVAGRVVRIITQAGRADSVVLSSFNPFLLREVKDLNPRIFTGLLVRRGASIPISNALLAGPWLPDAIHLRTNLLQGGVVQRLRRQGFRIFVWNVNGPISTRRALKHQVDGIITDRPHRIKDLIAELEQIDD